MSMHGPVCLQQSDQLPACVMRRETLPCGGLVMRQRRVLACGTHRKWYPHSPTTQSDERKS